MVVITLSDEDLTYISDLLKRDGSQINLMKESGTLEPDVCDRLVRRNSDIHAVIEARLVPYICIMTEIGTEEVYHLSFKEFESYFGEFPTQMNESQIMSYIANWCSNNGYFVDFKRKNKVKVA